jgi:hypothetical protein
VAIMCDLVHASTTELRIFAAGTHVDICQIPPLQARWEVIKTHQLNWTAWMDAVSFLAGDIDALSHPAHMMLGEILAIYLVLTCGSNFPLRVYLAIWRRGPLGVAALSQAAFDAQVVQSEVTARALQQSVCAAWAISFPLSQEYRSGEGVVSVEDYAQVYVAALERRQVIHPPKASSATTMGRHVAEARDGTSRRGRFEAPRRDGAGIDTQNICSKCGRHGHRSDACQHPIGSLRVRPYLAENTTSREDAFRIILRAESCPCLGGWPILGDLLTNAKKVTVSVLYRTILGFTPVSVV